FHMKDALSNRKWVFSATRSLRVQNSAFECSYKMHNWRQLTGNILLELKGAGSDSLCSYCLQIPTAVILVCEQQPLTYLLCQL
ncbi:mCG144721, partial [Mus musculus]